MMCVINVTCHLAESETVDAVAPELDGRRCSIFAIEPHHITMHNDAHTRGTKVLFGWTFDSDFSEATETELTIIRTSVTGVKMMK